MRAVGVPGDEPNERAVLVLSANSLQKWYLAPGHPDKLLYECNVEKYIREGFVDHVWVSDFFYSSCFSFTLIIGDMCVIASSFN